MNKDIRIEKFTKDYLPLMEFKKMHFFESMIIKDINVKLDILEKTGNGLVLIYDNIILGLMGHFVLWDGVCEVWAMPTVDVDKYPKTYLSSIREQMIKVFNESEYHRFQITCPDTDHFDSWATFLGFTCEGTLKQFINKELNGKIWARIK